MVIRYSRYKFPQYGFVTTILAGVVLFDSTSSYAAEYEYLIEATARAEQIDNPRRTNSSDDEEFLSQQRLRGTLSRATSKLITNIDYQGSKNSYRKNSLTDRTFVTGSSAIQWIIAPDRLSWDLSNTRSMQVVDALLPDTLDNRQVISQTSTGPSVTFQLPGANRLSGSVNYSIADYERSGLSSQDRTTAELLLSHNFSSKYISSIGGNFLRSEVDGAPILDFDRYDYFWQNQYVAEAFDISLMLGQNVVVRDNFDDLENFLINLTGNYRVNSQSSFSFNYSDSYEDIFSNMLSSRTDPSDLIGDRIGNSNLTQNYELVQKGISYTYTKSEFFSMNLGYTESEREYDTAFDDLAVARNQADKTYRVGANWTFFENLDFNAYARYTEQEFADINREQERNEYGFQAAYRISKSLYTQFTAQKVDQKGSLVFDNYDGVNYAISITYALGNK